MNSRAPARRRYSRKIPDIRECKNFKMLGLLDQRLSKDEILGFRQDWGPQERASGIAGRGNPYAVPVAPGRVSRANDPSLLERRCASTTLFDIRDLRKAQNSSPPP